MHLTTAIKILFFLFLTIEAAPVPQLPSEAFGGASPGSANNITPTTEQIASTNLQNYGDVLSNNTNSSILSENPVASGNEVDPETNTLNDTLNENTIGNVQVSLPASPLGLPAKKV